MDSDRHSQPAISLRSGARLACRGIVLATLLATGAAAPAAEPEKPTGLQSSADLTSNPANPNGLLYKRPDINYRQYLRFSFDPVQIYQGEGSSFSGTNETEKSELATFLLNEFKQSISERYGIASTPSPDVARIKLILVGIEANTPVLSTVTRLVPAGLAINALSAVANRQGTFMGSATYAIEFYDSQSGQLLAAALEKRSPSAIDVTATLGKFDAARSAIREGAIKLREAIDKIQAAP